MPAKPRLPSWSRSPPLIASITPVEAGSRRFDETWRRSRTERCRRCPPDPRCHCRWRVEPCVVAEVVAGAVAALISVYDGDGLLTREHGRVRFAVTAAP